MESHPVKDEGKKNVTVGTSVGRERGQTKRLEAWVDNENTDHLGLKSVRQWA
jgi:hypothetical protein